MAVNLIVGAAAVLLISLGLFGILSPGSAAKANDSAEPLGGRPASSPFGPTTPRRARGIGIFLLIIGVAVLVGLLLR